MPAARRPKGLGTVFQRKSDGLWVAQIPARDTHGKTTRIRKAFRERDDAVRALTTMRSRRAIAGSVEEFLERWLTDVAAPRVDQGTLPGYRRSIKEYVIPYVGEVALAALDAKRIAALLRELAADGVGLPTIRKTHATLRTALETAVEWDLIPINPALSKSARPPAHEPPERPTLDVARARKLLDLIRADRLAGVYVIAISMGLRQGEIFGLQWDDLDLERRILRLRHNLQETSGRTRLKGLKRRRQRRELPLPAVVVSALLARREAAKSKGMPTDHGYVFTNTTGGVVHKANFWRGSWSKVRAKLGLPAGVVLHFHDLRHTLGQLQRSIGADLETRRQQLGHASSRTTADTYGHTVPEALIAAARGIDDLLGAEGLPADADPDRVVLLARERLLRGSYRQRLEARR